MDGIQRFRRNQRQGDSHDLPIDPPRESGSTGVGEDRGNFTGSPIALDRWRPPFRWTVLSVAGRPLARTTPAAARWIVCRLAAVPLDRLGRRTPFTVAGLPAPSPDRRHHRLIAGIA